MFSCNCEASFTSKIPSPVPMFWVVAFIPGTLEEQLRKNANVRRSSLLKNFPLFVIFAFGFLVLFVLGFTTSFPTSLWLFLSGGVVGLCCTVPFGVAVLHAVTVPLSRCAWPDFGSETFDKLHRQYPTLRWDYCQDGRDTKIQVIRTNQRTECIILQCCSFWSIRTLHRTLCPGYFWRYYVVTTI